MRGARELGGSLWGPRQETLEGRELLTSAHDFLAEGIEPRGCIGVGGGHPPRCCAPGHVAARNGGLGGDADRVGFEQG